MALDCGPIVVPTPLSATCEHNAGWQFLDVREPDYESLPDAVRQNRQAETGFYCAKCGGFARGIQ